MAEWLLPDELLATVSIGSQNALDPVKILAPAQHVLHPCFSRGLGLSELERVVGSRTYLKEAARAPVQQPA
jgi:hypothetical protein